MTAPSQTSAPKVAAAEGSSPAPTTRPLTPLQPMPPPPLATRRLFGLVTVLLYTQIAFGLSLLIWTLCTHEFTPPPPDSPRPSPALSSPQQQATKPLAMQNYRFTWDGRAYDQFLCFWWTLHALVAGLVWTGVKRNAPNDSDFSSQAFRLYLMAVPTLQASLYLIYFLLFRAPVWVKYGPRLDVVTAWTVLSIAIAFSLHLYYRHRPSRQPDPLRDAAWQGRFETGLEDVDRGERFDQGQRPQT